MASTLYFTTSTSVPVSPSVSSLWEQGSASAGFVRRAMWTSDTGTTSDQEWTGTTSLGDEICQIQYISTRPLRAQTINGDIEVTTQQKVSSTGNTHFSVVVRVVTSAGAVRGTLLDLSNNTNAIPSTSYSNVTETEVASSVAVTAGDYLVVEFGYRVQATASKTFGTKAGSGTIGFTDTLVFEDAPTSMTQDYTSITLVEGADLYNDFNFTDNGGTNVFSVASGALPTGATLNTTTGEVFGNPTEVGVFTAVIRVSNAWGSTDSATITWTVTRVPNHTMMLSKMAGIGIGI